jgi:hypothetical protein
VGIQLWEQVRPRAATQRLDQYHQSVLSVYTRSPWFNEAVADLATRLSHAGFDMHSAQQGALARMYSMLNTQAQALSYIDVYWLLSLISVSMFFLCLLAKNEPGGSGNIHMH